MSYKIIIADDEPKLISLIKELIDFTELDIELVAECRDGEEAYEKILEYEPDIVLSDIKMPVYDGIGLIEMVRKHDLNTRFILISGYRHFEYARSAIRLNVVDYLLKPIDAIQLKETLVKACRKIEQLREEKAGSEELKKARIKEEESRMESFWQELLYGEGLQKQTLLSEEICNKTHHTVFEEGLYQVLCVYCNIGGLLGQDNSGVIEKMNTVIDKTIGEVGKVYYHTSPCQTYVLVLNYKPEQKNQIHEAIVSMYYSMRDMREIYGDIDLVVGCSRVKESIKELPKAFEEAHHAEWGRMVLKGNFIIEYSQIAGLPRFSETETVSDAECAKISECVKYLKEEEAGELFHGISKRAGERNNGFPGDMYNTFERLKNAVLNGSEKKENKKRLEEECFYAGMESKSFQKLFQNVYLGLEKYMKEEKKKIEEKHGKQIAEAIHYINRNYNKDLSLEEVADASNVSPGYLSKLFKTEIQMGFLEYVTQIRLKESEKLLSQTSLSIKEIAISVGYSDEKYYSKLFKRTTGIKPSEFRKIYS